LIEGGGCSDRRLFYVDINSVIRASECSRFAPEIRRPLSTFIEDLAHCSGKRGFVSPPIGETLAANAL